MPPTPFHPTHQTPFKSSISSAQQAKKRQGEEDQLLFQQDVASSSTSTHWPTALPASALDSRQWTYLAEGGKNLLIRYEGPTRFPFVHESGRRVAIRLTKVPRKAATTTAAVHGGEVEEDNLEGDDIDPLLWRERVLQPDLGSAGSLPPLLKVQDDGNGALQRFLREMAGKIESMRPLERRKKHGIDETGRQGLFITEDLSANIPGKHTISLEIKPKCGFLPSSSTVAGSLTAETAAIKTQYSRYRMHRVLKFREQPTLEDFEAYYDPLDLYSGEDARVEKASRSLLDDWRQREGNLRIFLNGNPVDVDSEQKLDDVLRQHFGTSLSDNLKSMLISKEMQDVLARLLSLQSRYDNLDVEGVSALYEKETGKSLTEAREADVSLSEYQDVVQGKSQSSAARQAIVKLLLSAMYKDCSVFIRCIEGQTPASIYLVDLDPKPFTKLAYFEQIDKDVCHNFRGWAKAVGILK